MKHRTKAQRAHARRRYFAMPYDPAPWLAEKVARGCRCNSPFVGVCGRCDPAWHFGCPCHDVNLPGATPTVRAEGDHEFGEGSFKCICGPCRDRTCGGTGWLQCWCGGETCICLACGAGEVECLGCRDCDTPDDEYYGGGDDV